MNGNFSAPAELNNFKGVALGIGGIGLLVMALGFYFNTEQALRSWLIGVIFWGGISVGSLGLLILQYLTGGAWGVVIRRIIEASSRTIWFFALLFLPLVFGVTRLYQWTAPYDEVMQGRVKYLNPTAWGLRVVLYFGLWFVMAALLNKWSEEKEATGNFGLLQRMSQFCGPTMVIFALVVSFAAIDWVMTLDPHWYSTIFGLLFVIGWGLSALAFTITILAWLADREPMNRIVGKRHFHDLGKLMLAMVMVWTYFNFSQFLIIWSGNLPEETPWYLTRMTGTWGWIGLFLLLFHFAFPFLLLLSRDLKRAKRWLAMLAIFILVVRVIDLFYLIAPSPMMANHTLNVPFQLSWMDFVAPVAVGGLWLWRFFSELKSRPVIHANDPFLAPAIEHGKGH